jgi:hypothetical protein
VRLRAEAPVTVHVDELVTDVSVEPEAPSRAPQPPEAWPALAALGERLRRLEADAWRTAAEGFDD